MQSLYFNYLVKMLSVRFMLVFICFNNVFGFKKQHCKSMDTDCIAKAVREHTYQEFVTGMPGVASSDPLQLVEIVVDQSNLKYTLKKPTLIGMKNCDLLKINLNKKASTFSYELLCPHLIIQSEYEVTGDFDGITVEGNGNCKITYDKYYITIPGKYERVIGKDGKVHFKIIEFTVDLDLQAGATNKYQNLIVSDSKKAEVYSKKIEELTRDVVMKIFLQKFIHNLKDFQKSVPLEDAHVRYV